ncbi:hypothetical protein [Granulicella arctica]|uniref:Thioredoxin domain-containing protein n=1 Tax=Granulicella arctica TaxID=940613 RepID=A0A7Y9TIL3_9BACT|nr:hypothetical protein [Granulicella arctica]NYF81160.1 hypothetical protein [Granulicella arctica]
MVLIIPRLLSLTFLLAGAAAGQAAPTSATPQLSPQAAYDQATRPLEITRRSIANWSDSETEALGIAIKQASEACSERSPEQFSGDDLIAFARLCSLGQQWPSVSSAAARYIGSTEPKPQLTQAYAYQIDAALHANDAKAGLASSLAMLQAVPYDSLVDETIRSTLHYLQLAFTPDALTLYAAREPLILQALRTPPPTAAMPIHVLYADGLAYAALQQFAGDPQAAAKTISELDLATPSSLSPDDSIPIAETRRQYALLGTHLPRIPLTVSLFSVGETPRINPNYGNATVFFLFPDWCAQCVRMAQQLRPTLYRISQNDVHLYGLLAQPAPSVAAPPHASARSRSVGKEPPEPESPKTPSELLRGTPTLIVPPATIATFAATDFPLLIATGPDGIIRFIQPAPENALNPGDFLDQVTNHIAQQWPRETPAQSVLGPGSAQP